MICKFRYSTKILGQEEFRRMSENALIRDNFCESLITLDDIDKPINPIDMSRITSAGFRILSSYNQLYSDTISEMIASPYKYHITTYYILDTKFLIWKQWLERILLLFRYRIITEDGNGKFKRQVIALTEYCTSCYESHLKQASPKIYDFKQIMKFLEVHEKTYDAFSEQVIELLSFNDTALYYMNKVMKQLADQILFWMNYTIFEVLSLDRCIHNGGEVLISRSVITAKTKYNLDLVEQIKECGLAVNELLFVDPSLTEYEYLFKVN